MSARLNPYLSFAGNAAEAMAFYQSVFGGELETMKFGDMPDMPGNDPAQAELIMHSSLAGDHGMNLMGADTPPPMEVAPNGSVSLSGDDEALLRGYWDRLAEGATITVPLEKAPWGDSFGMLSDRFGVPWLVNIAGSA